MRIDAEQATRELAVAIRGRTLIPFCGAGISLQAHPGVPSAHDFLESQKKLGLTWQEAASLIERDTRFSLTFSETFGDPPGDLREPSEQHRLLACLDAPYYITTNYDVLLERALQRVRGNAHNGVGVLNASRLLSDAFRYASLVIKLHGDVNDPEMLVFSEQDYIQRMQSPKPVDGFVRLLFATHTILFVGYSLEAPHVREILQWEAAVGQATPRWKYLLLPSLSRNREAYLNSMNVKPVVIGKRGEPYETSVREFLVRLWEQREHQATFIRLLEMPHRSQEELIREAILFRQSGDLDKADQCLTRVYAEGEAFLVPDVLADLLWVTVSVYDKCEKWNTLEDLDKLWIAPLLNRNDGILPHEVLQSIRCVYEASLAIAFSRAGNFEKAGLYARSSLGWRCTSTASQDMRVVSANSHVSLALVNLHLWAMSKDSKLLLEALETLTVAERLLEANMHRDDASQNHHLGRFFGTRAFLTIAMADAGLGEPGDRDLLERDARSAYEPERCRTRFGALAGKYCGVVIQYWYAMKATNDDERSRRLDAAEEHLELIERSLDRRQAAARLKVRLLRSSIEYLRENGRPPSRCDLDNTFDSYRSEVHAPLVDSIERMGPDRWMLLPLN